MKLKIAITSALSWPYVRRGNRLAHTLADYLARRGHEVRFITAKPGRVIRTKIYGGVPVEFNRLALHPLLMPFKTHVVEAFAPSCFRSLLREDFDIIQTNFYPDGFAASLIKSLRGTPFVNNLYICEPLYPPTMLGKLFFSNVVRSSSRVISPSNYVNNELIEEFGLTGDVIPPPLDISRFTPAEKKNLYPTRILCTCSVNDPRKRIAYLVKAFERLINVIPDATLQLAGDASPEITGKLLLSVNGRARKAIEILHVNSDKVLLSLYRNAAVSVVPSLREPFGMVTAESLASGTPVVGTRSGATPEILDNPGVGVLFEPTDDPDELCRAILRGLELANNPRTPQRCWEHAQQYSLDAIGAKYENLYSEILGSGKRRRSRKRIQHRETKMGSSAESDTSKREHPPADKPVSNRFFDDVLDELDVTYDTYFAIDFRRPRCVGILNWLFSQGIQNGNMLVLSSFPRPFTMLAEKLGFNTKGIALAQRTEPWKCSEDQMLLGDLQNNIRELAGYDVIICDDLLHYLEFPLRTIQMLKKKLNPNGILILTTKNATSGMARLKFLFGRNIYPYLVDDLQIEGSSAENRQRLLPYREYTLREVEAIISSSGFDALYSHYMVGEKAIDNNWVSMPIKRYLLRQWYHFFQKIVPPLRSHLFVAGRKKLLEDSGTSH